ncbi:BTAD domain-containing putative transcriptional regulator [Streptomyces sp. NPDC002870]|uniref:BTAD domain-containing putative transcriptional regulator n=1 Tax=Streptomyces sp. NPDC002870 TaxID=3364666 RepID=UPI003681E040
MKFRLLGPLEVEAGNELVELGGKRQRAALAFLLLHANTVVSTSQLLDALWTADRVPLTARKILQNAVWRLRSTLARHAGGTNAPELITRAPGYMVRVRPEQVDLLVYQQRAAEGRAALAAGDPYMASKVLHEALSLWRGPALADLVEDGIAWPDLIAVQKKHLDLLEDRFEAELACGGHQTVLRELEAFVEAEPLRERASQQLMLALYRCGRQAEALGVYGRVRTALVEGLGLEPGRQMQLLQQSVLTQDPALDLAPDVRRREETLGVGTTVSPAPAPAAGLPPVAETPRASQADVKAGSDAVGGMRGAHRPASILLLRFTLGAEFDPLPPEDADRVLDAVSHLAREKIEEFGGRAAASIGSVQLGLFEERPDLLDNAERAVRAACAVRDLLGISVGPLAPTAPVVVGLAVQAAVTTGDAVVCHWPVVRTVQPWIGGDVVDACQEMLEQAPPGEVQVCDETRRSTGPLVTYHRVRRSPAKWQVRTVGRSTDLSEDRDAAPDGVGREGELQLMTGLLRRSRDRRRPHLITVLGDSGFGKTRLLMEFQRRVMEEPDTAMVLAAGVPRQGGGSALSAPAEMLAAYCGITGQDTADSAGRKARETVVRLTGCEETGERMLSLLHAQSVPDPGRHGGPGSREVLTLWRDVLLEAAREQPLVLIWDDLHRADDLLLEVVEQLADDHADVPLLNVVGAHTRLLERRPAWAGGRHHMMTISLAPISGDAVDRLLQSLLVPDDNTDVA